MKKIIFVCLLSLCTAFNAQAIVSMETIHLGKPPQGFAGAFDLDLAFEGGNTERSGAASGVKLQWTDDQITDFILASYAYAESAGVRDKNRGFTHYRHIHRLDEQLAWEAFAQLSFNEFTHLTMRSLAGGGVRLTLGELNDKTAFFLGLGGFYERERLDTFLPGEDDTEQAVRANTYLVIKYQFNSHVSLVSTTYYQPKLGDGGDFRAIEDLSLVSRLTESSSLKVEIDIAHDSEPPLTVKQTDSVLKVGIVINF
ncbi:MAG: DUF481 domain-containing protein [Gammaproteobacteria bacterium]|nr:DUF481 domain-containing protein [Gammaproteobacteria bacterium]